MPTQEKTIRKLKEIASELGEISWDILIEEDSEEYEALENARKLVNFAKRSLIRKTQEVA